MQSVGIWGPSNSVIIDLNTVWTQVFVSLNTALPYDGGGVNMRDSSATESNHWPSKSLEIFCKQKMKFRIGLQHEEEEEEI